ncbi:MAG: tetratricopeptide repeat protein, partial [Candidatus Riflebacteria bacterium]|nr:tetratricopeptide repeat protein [Candidatus Riflebacteria bacterium]
YNQKLLLSIARQTSDSVLKRVSLYLAWSGRAAYGELPLKFFKRTPVKLDPREESDLVWNSLFNCRLPTSLLLHPPALPPADIDRETRLWIELRSLPEFCEKQATAGMIFIRESPEPRIRAIIENYFIEIFKGLNTEKLEWLLANVMKSDDSLEFLPKLPRMLVSFITNRSDVLNIRFEEIRDWVARNLQASDPGLAEAAIYLGALIGLDDDVIARFNEISQQLFYAGRFSIINFFASHYLSRGVRLAHTAYIDVSKTFSAQERFEEAVSLLEEAKQQYEDESGSALGHLFYATALVLKRLNRDDEALAELFLARETFILENEHEWLARTENALGNVYFSRGHPQNARSHYHSGLHLARQYRMRNLLPSFLANLGLVEFDTGRFYNARLQLTRAYNLYKSINNHWNASVTGMGLGKLYLKLGYFFKAMKIFREVLLMREEIKNLSGVYEIYSLLAWISELLGKSAAAKTWLANAAEMKKAGKLEPRACHVGESLLAMTDIFNCRFKEGEQKYRKLLEDAIARQATGIQIGDLQYGLASSLIFQGKEAEGYELLSSARRNIAVEEGRIQLTLLNILTATFFPERNTKLNLENELNNFRETGCYDSFWGHIALRLHATGSPAALEYLKFHIGRTPPSMMKLLCERLKGLKEVANTLHLGKNRADEFFTLMTRKSTKTMHHDEYLLWKKNRPDGHLIFDSPAGQISFSDNQIRLKAGSIPHNVLLQLFMAQPHALSVESLYRSAWGTDYDPEFDYGAFKSTLQRLKKILQSLCPTTRISAGKISDSARGVKLTAGVPWVLIFK